MDVSVSASLGEAGLCSPGTQTKHTALISEKAGVEAAAIGIGKTVGKNDGFLEMVSFITWRPTSSVPLKKRPHPSEGNAELK
jgi:hypothetical protein